MTTTSTIVPAKQALVDALLSRPALDLVGTFYADPGDKARREQFFIGEVRNALQDPVALKAGRRKRDEEYELDVFVDVMSKATPLSSEVRCMELVAELEDILADDPTIGAVPGVLWATVTDMRMKTTETGDGPATRAIVTITVRARLS